MKLSEDIKSKLPEIIDVCKRHKVVKLYLFGSVLTDNFNENSDVDFLIDFD